MPPNRRESWFRGYTNWYVRATVLFVQVVVVAGVLHSLLGTVGVVISGFAATLLLFRQITLCIRQELRRASD
ncbi:hypothetical protein [Halopelagius fulvigenes]|uniref:Uncharacterized protein n=1 Tax=Halopelagius fulvigenes TaxID=1198324 RepID=A0ABD5U1M9_9EURY